MKKKRVIKHYKLEHTDFWKLGIFIFLFACCIHVFLLSVEMLNGDDTFFIISSENVNLISYLIERWNTWSSRVIIEGVMVLLLKSNKFLWVILDSLVCVLLYYSVLKILNGLNDKRTIIIVSCLFVLFPFTYLVSAGRYATTLNYLWPLTFAMYYFSWLIDLLDNKKANFLQKISLLCCLIYASNQEQICALLVGFIVCALISDYVMNHRVRLFLVISIFVSITMLLLTLNCPGNVVRTASETARWYPEFSEFSLIYKLILGVLSTSSFILSSKVLLFQIFIILICVFSYKKKECVSLSLSICSLLAWIFGRYLTLLNKSENVVKLFLDNVGNSVITKSSVLYLLSVLIVVGCISISVYRLFEKKKSLFILLVFYAALCERFIMGFSPTLFASGTRTFVSTYLLMLIIDGFLLKWLLCSKESS